METFEAILKVARLLLVDFVNVAAWPVFAIIFICMFRKQLGDLLARMIELSWNGAKAAPPQQQIPTSEIDGNATVDRMQISEATQRATPPDEVLAAIEQFLRNDIQERKLDALTPDQQRELYIREYAIKLRSEHFALIGLHIFGTQVALLRHLAAGVPQSKDAIMPIFDEHRRRVGNLSSPDFYIWISFLLTKGLIETNAEGQYSITAAGKQFLQVFAPANNISESTRPF